MSLTRRQIHGIALSALPLVPLRGTGAKVQGVMLGVQTYSFRDRPLDAAIAAMKEIGIGYAELWFGHVEPFKPNVKQQREDVRKWRLTAPLDHFRQVREKFDKAGIVLYAYTLAFREDFTDEEIARAFEMAKALGVKYMTSSANVSTAARVDPFATKAGIRVGMHNHANLRENEFARPEDFEAAMAGKSSHIAINLDIGHYVAAGFDPIPFIEKHHKNMVSVHLKDRKKNQGANVPFGEGDTPIREVLQLLKKKKYPIPAMIEYEYKGVDTMVEVRRCWDYCVKALA